MATWRAFAGEAFAEELLTPVEYEEGCQLLLSLLLVDGVEFTATTGDGGIDLRYSERFDLGEALTYGQCKRSAGVVPVEEVRAFRGVFIPTSRSATCSPRGT